MTEEMGMYIDARLSMRHIDVKGLVVFTSHAWRRLFDIRGPLVKLMLEFFNTYRFDNLVLDSDTNGGTRLRVLGWSPLRLCHHLIAHTIAGRWQAPENVTSTDLYFLRSMDQDVVNLPYVLTHYLFRHVEGRNQGAQMSGGYFIARLADHFGLLIEESLQGTTIVVRELGEIDLAELARLHICASLGDVWTSRLARLEEEVHRIWVSLGKQHEVIDAMARDLSRFIVWAAGGLSQLLDSAGASCTRLLKMGSGGTRLRVLGWSPLRLCHRLIAHTIAGRRQAPEKVTSTDLYFLRSMDQDAVNLPYLLAHYLFRHVEGMNQGAQMSSGYFIARFADLFGLLIEESLQGTTIVVRELGEIDLFELARLHICASLGDVWTWVA
nr:hypothetical protein [Tanacetum cinerariifolium]